ncbi:MbtH family protein [Paenibacillus glacialis]|uniref:Protein mbtH n=1 Tax=Paenibacillus glacialis TaxID=494026 RepID=A0A168HPT8_9BACL|nr:MbtH family protein [Paenibacillus glacialis]OAB38406.1 protein mbtH [Paenibacillus glacialis]
MTNPFERADTTYLVLMNDEKQYSLWPSYIIVPEGWTVVVADQTREICTDYINAQWTDMRPRSLQEVVN